MRNVHSVHSVHSTQCTVHSAQCIVHCAQCTVHSVHFTVHSVHALDSSHSGRLLIACPAHAAQIPNTASSGSSKFAPQHHGKRFPKCQASTDKCFIFKESPLQSNFSRNIGLIGQKILFVTQIISAAKDKDAFYMYHVCLSNVMKS